MLYDRVNFSSSITIINHGFTYGKLFNYMQQSNHSSPIMEVLSSTAWSLLLERVCFAKFLSVSFLNYANTFLFCGIVVTGIR
jgi:hypothetical protein